VAAHNLAGHLDAARLERYRTADFWLNRLGCGIHHWHCHLDERILEHLYDEERPTAWQLVSDFGHITESRAAERCRVLARVGSWR
jgi:hypothetical protein